MSLFLLINPKTEIAEIAVVDGASASDPSGPPLEWPIEWPIEPLKDPEYKKDIQKLVEPTPPEPKEELPRVRFKRIPTLEERLAQLALSSEELAEWLRSLEGSDLLAPEIPEVSLEDFLPMRGMDNPLDILSGQYLPKESEESSPVQLVMKVRRVRQAKTKEEKIAAIKSLAESE